MSKTVTGASRPTIYEALRVKLGREPTHRELCDEVRRILAEASVERASASGKRRRPQVGR